MRALIAVVTFAASWAGTCVSMKAQQQQTFDLVFCNQSGNLAYIAVTVLTTPAMWRVKGWYAIDNQQCTALGSYFGSRFYYIGKAKDGAVWRFWQADPNDKTSLYECVLADAFDYEAGKWPSCTADQGHNFSVVTVTGSAPFTQTLH